MKKIISIVIFVFAGIILSAQTDTTASKKDAVVTADSTAKKASETEPVFRFAEEMPDFPGGLDAFRTYLSKNIKYPVEERKAKIQGTVYISFTIEKDGSVSNVYAVKEVSGAPGLTAEAIRVISAMPKWSPGKMNGRPVRVEMTQPVKFVL